MEGDKTVSLEWTGHGQALSAGIWDLFKDDYLVDISVTCHGQCVRVHKLALAIFIPILKQSLLKSGGGGGGGEDDEDDSEGAAGAIVDSSTTLAAPESIDLGVYVSHADDVQYLLEFIYTGKVRDIPAKHLNCLMNVAESMGIDALANTIRAHPTASQVLLKRSEEAVDQSLSSPTIAEGSVQDHHLHQPSPSSPKVDTHHAGGGDLGVMDGILRMLLGPEEMILSTSNDPADPPSLKDMRQSANRRYTLRPGCLRKKPPEVVSITDDDDDDDDEEEDSDDVDEPPPKLSLNRRCKAAATTSASAKAATAVTASKCRKRRVNNSAAAAAKKSISSEGSTAGKTGASAALKTTNKRLGVERLQHCNFCDHKTWQKNVLVQHLAARHKVDLKGNPLPDMKCAFDGCDFVCVAKHQLNQHVQRKHTVDKPFKCRQCSYTAVFRSDFNKHIQIQHLKKRDFLCDACGFRSQTKGGLNAHARTHERIKPLKCDTCGAEYSDTLSYRLHVQNHTGNVVNAYVCHVCGHSCRRRSQLRIHLRKKHGIELESGRRKYGSISSSDTPPSTTTTTTTTTTVPPYVLDGDGADTSTASSSVGAGVDHFHNAGDSDSIRASLDA